MLIYYLAYGFIIFTAFTVKRENKSENIKRTILISASLLTFLFVFGLRHPSMGIDLAYGSPFGYLGSFEKISNMPLLEVIKMEKFQNYENGYVSINKLMGYIGKDPQVFIFVYSLLTFLPISYVIYKKSNNPLFSVLIYMGLPCFVAHFSTLRQILAIGICLLAVDYIETKQLAKFLVIVFLATTIHSSAILFLAAYPAYHIKLSLHFRLASLFALPLLFIFRIPLFNILSKILKDNAEAVDNGSINFFIILIMIYMFCIMFFDIKDKRINGYMNIFYICCFCQIFGNIYMTATRVAWLFMTILVFLLPLGLSTMKSKRQSDLFSTMIMGAFIVYGLYSIQNTSWAQAVPHSFYWEYI